MIKFNKEVRTSTPRVVPRRGAVVRSTRRSLGRRAGSARTRGVERRRGDSSSWPDMPSTCCRCSRRRPPPRPGSGSRPAEVHFAGRNWHWWSNSRGPRRRPDPSSGRREQPRGCCSRSVTRGDVARPWRQTGTSASDRVRNRTGEARKFLRLAQGSLSIGLISCSTWIGLYNPRWTLLIRYRGLFLRDRTN